MEASTGGQTPLSGKVLSWVLLGGIIYGGMKLINFVTPFIVESAYNIAILIGIAALGMLGIMNYKAIFLWYLGFCTGITKWFAEQDPIRIMNGYLVKLRRKITNLEKTLLFVSGKKIQLERLVQENNKKQIEYTKQALAAKQQGENSAATLNATKAMGCKQSIDIYTPILKEYESKYDFLVKLNENWNLAYDGLAFDIELKTEQLSTLKSMVQGLKSIDDLTNSNSSEAQILAMSFKAAESDISQRLAYIDDFEKRAKPMLTDMKVKKQSQENDALSFLEEASRDQNLLLPDYKTFTPTLSTVEEVVKIDSKYKM